MTDSEVIEKDQKVWLSYAYDKFKTCDTIDERQALIELWDDLSYFFSTENLDYDYFKNGRITLFGIWLIDPNSKLLQECDSLINAISILIKENPLEERFSISQLSNLKLDRKKIEQLVQLLFEYGGFISGTSGGPDAQLYLDSFTVSERNFSNYKNFKSISKRLKKRFEIKNKPRKKITTREFSLTGGFKKSNLGLNIEKNLVVKNTAFIIMQINPDNPELEDILLGIKEVCRKFGIEAVRADEIQHEDKITDIILDRIKKSEFIIADLTAERPNVYYEVGFAHSEGKRPILLRKKGTKLHFDLSIHNVPEYKNIHELKRILNKKFESITGSLPSKK
ncbi:MAG: hypothetical protein RIE52_10780 [Balneola sp.]|jgi:hypothetical protein